MFENKKHLDGLRWRIQVNFNDQQHMNEKQRKNDAQILQTIQMGDFIKTLYLNDFLELNNISTLTLDISSIKNSVYQIVNKESECEFRDYRCDSSDEEEEEDSLDNFENIIFKKKKKEPDIILNGYHEAIIENVVSYYFSRLDEYVICLKKSLEAEEITVNIV